MPLQCHPQLYPGKSAPVRPAHFDERYVLPEHQVFPLMEKNAHPLDSKMEFLEEPHVYLFDNVAIGESVTGMAHQYQSGFDGNSAIRMMKSSKKECWPRLKYAIGVKRGHDCSTIVPKNGVMLVCDGLTLAVSRPYDFDQIQGNELVENLKMLMIQPSFGKRSRNEPEVYTFERGMTDDEIKKSWEMNGLLARNLGTEAHLQMQYMVEGQPFRMDPEVMVGIDILNKFPDEWIGYRCEWEIVFPEANLAGSIDLVIQHKETKNIIIVDYKRSEKLKSKLRGYSFMKEPMKHLDDADGVTYALQLGIYQYVLEKKYGLTVEDRILISLHPDNPFFTSVPYLEQEVHYMMESRIAKENALKDCPIRCPISDLALANAVDVEGMESSIDKKTALAKGYTIKGEDLVTIMLVNDWLNDNYVPIPLPDFTTKWKTIMPKDGLIPRVFI